MEKKVNILVFLIILFSFSFVLTAQEGRGEGRLTGYVQDTDKKPIEGAKVKLKYHKFNRELETTSNKKGKFTFATLGVGAVEISAEKKGFIRGGNQTRVSGASKNPKQYIVLKRIEEVKTKLDLENETAKNDFEKANNLFKNQKYEEALSLFTNFKKIKPNMYKVGVNIGNCLLELKRFDEAIKEYQIILEKIKADKQEIKEKKLIGQLYASIGDIFMRQNKLKQAEKYFKDSIAIDQSDYALAYNIAEILFAANKTADSITYYKLAIKIKPEWPKSYKQIGYAYLNQGNVKKSIEMLKKFLELDPKSKDAPGIRDVIKSLK